MPFRKILICILCSALWSCDKDDTLDISESQMAHILDKLAFSCTQEMSHLPNVSPDAQGLYNYARMLQSDEGVKDHLKIERYYRLAYAAGSYKAASNLHTLIFQGNIQSDDPENEVIDIVESMIAQGIPGGYYDMGHYLEIGYGVKQDTSRANSYFRRAADLGNPDAQLYVSKLLEQARADEKLVIDMRRCAMDQGNAQAAFNYGVYVKTRGNYPEAIQAFQKGVRYGSLNSAGFLRGGFSSTDPTQEQYYFALPADAERTARYDRISTFLRTYEHLGANIPDIENIVPLPPAKLPEWDGAFEWQKQRDSAPPVKIPSEEMILKLSNEKGLNPVTGRYLVKTKKQP